ncbi:MAG: hypothetical protein H6509_12875 [Bryobacterales bacterium]|nr:hypothetical protein [Bryobacterales bacterium]
MTPLDDRHNIGATVGRSWDEIHRKRLIPVSAPPEAVQVSPLTSVFLQDLSEQMLVRFGEDPLAAFDTPLALVQQHPSSCWADLDDGIICISESFLEMLEFAAAHASLVNIVRRIEKKLAECGNDPRGLLNSIATSRSTLHAMQTTRLLLLMIGEKPAPQIAKVLPDGHKRFVHSQIAASATFAVLHEQAHLEIQAGRLAPGADVETPDAFLHDVRTGSREEEYAADLFAAGRIKGDRNGSFVRAASFFFFNQWVIDYLLHNQRSSHPPAFNRIQRLMHALPNMQQEDKAFFTLMTEGLNAQSQLRRALSVKEPSERYAALLRYARAAGEYSHYEDLADALCRTYEELGLSGRSER